MAEQPGLRFAGLLRQLRAEAGLTQEELAEAAGLSPRSVSDLERGIHRAAHKDTALLLAGALGLAGPVRALFVAAARGRGPAAEVLAARDEAAPGAFAAAATRSLPRDIASFTGRRAELAQLMGALAAEATGGGVVGIHAIGGMAGIGKTTLAVHAAHQLAASFPDGQFFLPLHAHTPGQRPVDPADALASLLLTAGVAARHVPPGLEARAGRWRDHLAGKRILLLLDDAAGHEQVRPLLPGTAGSLVLVTSRRHLAALEDAAGLSLDTLPPGEAAALLARLAGRPGLRAGDAAAGEITRLCGHLPLAIGMLARQLYHHPSWTAAGLAADLAAAQDRLELMQAENLSVTAAFDLSYRDLTDGQQRLFRRLGLHPGPDIDGYAAAALDDTSLAIACRQLGDLFDQYMIAEPTRGRYRLHDLLREHARALAAADDPADCDAASGRLLDYYLYTAVTASQHIATRPNADGRPPPCRPSAWAPQLHTAQEAASWLETESPNLHAATDYAAVHGPPLHAIQIPAAMGGFLLAQGRWDRAIALHQTALTMARNAGDRPGEAGALNRLGVVQRLTGSYPAAAANHQQALALYRDLGDRPGQADALNQLGVIHAQTGSYPAAAASQQQALALYRDLSHRPGEAGALNDLGAVHQMTGDYPAATASHQQALALYRDLGGRLGQGIALIQLGVAQRLTGDYPAAAASLTRALALHRDLGERRRQGIALTELGVLQQLTDDYPAAAANYQQALELFRDLGDRLGEACVFNQLGVLHRLTRDYPAATASHQQALALYRDLGDRLGQADALNNLGELLCQSRASHRARDHHIRALAIARDLGAPLEEARALEGIGHCRIQDGNPSEGAAQLRKALVIYQRIGAPGAHRLQDILRRYQP